MNTENEKSLLTKTETDVLRLLAEGLTNTEIADKMYLSLHTIKSHTESIFRKTNSHNRIQAVLFGLKNGYIALDIINNSNI